MNKQFLKEIQIANEQRKGCLASLVTVDMCTKVQSF